MLLSPRMTGGTCAKRGKCGNTRSFRFRSLQQVLAVHALSRMSPRSEEDSVLCLSVLSVGKRALVLLLLRLGKPALKCHFQFGEGRIDAPVEANVIRDLTVDRG
jgi:hypothetical protein